MMNMTELQNTQSAKQWREDAALERFKLISPLLDENLDTAKRCATAGTDRSTEQPVRQKFIPL